jgi:hypothetical protein
MAPGHGQYEVGFNDQAVRDEVAPYDHEPNAAARVVPAKLEVLRAQAAVARQDGCASGPSRYRAGAARQRADDADFRAHIGRCRRISSGNVNRRVERPSRELP